MQKGGRSDPHPLLVPDVPGVCLCLGADRGCVYFDGVGMTDRELLELAAKAAGIFDLRFDNKGVAYRNVHIEWNPLTDDGDALRLAVKLEACIDFMDRRVVAGAWPEVVIDFTDEDYRRAIVRAAAEIGRSMT